MKKYPNNVKKIIEKLGIKPNELAKMLGVTEACVYNYCYESHRPSPLNARKIIDIAYLYGLKINMEDVYKFD